MRIFYTGIGSRLISDEVKNQIYEVSKDLKNLGFILRSGGAIGSDTAFESMVYDEDLKEIYLPWKNYNDNKSSLYDIDEKAFALAKTLHPVYDNLSQGVKRLHARNTYQVLGKDLNTPSSFLICYTPCGSETIEELTPESGGTSTAIKLACLNHIPVFNLQKQGAIQRLYKYICLEINYIPFVYNKYKDKNKIRQNDVYIGRGSYWGNPFVIGEKYTRDNVCDLFEEKILPNLNVEPLRGKNLICFCAPARCHGHSIFKKLYGTKTPGKTSIVKLPLGWDRIDKTKNNYEVSSVGDKRFSALYAKLSDGLTIEQHYQLYVKGYIAVSNDWRTGKGKPPLNGKDHDQLYKEFKQLWIRYLDENEHLKYILKIKTSGKYITDCFGWTPVNQARALYEILVEK